MQEKINKFNDHMNNFADDFVPYVGLVLFGAITLSLLFDMPLPWMH